MDENKRLILDDVDDDDFIDYMQSDLLDWVKHTPEVKEMFFAEFQTEYREWLDGD